MRRQVLCAALALCLAASAGAPALADGERSRLAGVNEYLNGKLDVEYIFTYEQGEALPTAGRKNVLGEHTVVMFEGSSMEYERDTLPSLDWTYAYDGAGRLTEFTETYPSGNTYISRWVYGDDGRLVRRERERPEGAGLPLQTTVAYTYDEAGRLCTETSADDGAANLATEYMYGKDGLLTAQNTFSLTGSEPLDENGQPIHGKGAVSQTVCDYDGDGRVVRELSVVDGMLWSETYYTYEDDPVFTVRYSREYNYMNDEDDTACLFTVRDTAGESVLSFAMSGTPELTRDGTGRLVRAETEGGCLEFIWA